MARRNISLPDDLDDLARAEGLNVSALARQAIVGEIDRRARMTRLDNWLDELDAAHGPPSATINAAAEEWAESVLPVRAGKHGPAAEGSGSDVPPRTRRATG